MEQTLDLTPFTMALREAFPEQVAFCGIMAAGRPDRTATWIWWSFWRKQGHGSWSAIGP